MLLLTNWCHSLLPGILIFLKQTKKGFHGEESDYLARGLPKRSEYKVIGGGINVDAIREGGNIGVVDSSSGSHLKKTFAQQQASFQHQGGGGNSVAAESSLKQIRKKLSHYQGADIF